MIALRSLTSRWIVPLLVVVMSGTAAQATTVDVATISLAVSGPGPVTGEIGPAGLDIVTDGSYAFNFTFENTTGMSGSPVNALSFFDVFISLDLDGTPANCGGVAAEVLAGASASFNCVAALNLGAGHHDAAAFLDLTLAQNPFPLTDGTLLDADDVKVGGAPAVPLPDKKKGRPGIYVGVAVAVGGGIGAAVALGGKQKEAVPVAEPTTLVLLASSLTALLFSRSRLRSGIRTSGARGPFRCGRTPTPTRDSVAPAGAR